MGHNDRREIFERLEALERLARGHGGRDDDRHRSRDRGHRDHHQHEHGHDHHDGGRDHGREDFDERRIIDTIVGLVSENVGRMLEEHQQATARRNGDGGGRQDGDGGSEKRIVDLIVACVSEHVKEIVSAELDRRFGRVEAGPTGDVQPLPPSAPSPPRAESSKPERS